MALLAMHEVGDLGSVWDGQAHRVGLAEPERRQLVDVECMALSIYAEIADDYSNAT